MFMEKYYCLSFEFLRCMDVVLKDVSTEENVFHNGQVAHNSAGRVKKRVFSHLSV